ncbi:MAG: hypothetical protein ABS948_08215 [Solibacillus sp.]
MTFNEFLDLKADHTRVDVLIGTLGQHTVLVPLFLNLELCIVKIFAAEISFNLTNLQEVDVTELQMHSFSTSDEAEQFYSELQLDRSMNQLLIQYLRQRGQLSF